MEEALKKQIKLLEEIVALQKKLLAEKPATTPVYVPWYQPYYAPYDPWRVYTYCDEKQYTWTTGDANTATSSNNVVAQ